MDRNRAPSLISAIRLSLLTTEIGKVKGEPRATDLLGGMFSNRLNITLLKKSGKRRGNIEFAALCQMGHICYTALPIEEQEYPAFPARELSCKCLCRYGRDNLVRKSVKSEQHNHWPPEKPLYRLPTTLSDCKFGWKVAPLLGFGKTAKTGEIGSDKAD